MESKEDEKEQLKSVTNFKKKDDNESYHQLEKELAPLKKKPCISHDSISNENHDSVELREKIFDILSDIKDPECQAQHGSRFYNLEQLDILNKQSIQIDGHNITITLDPLGASRRRILLIGFCLNEKLLTKLPEHSLKFNINLAFGRSMPSTKEIEKLLNDKERMQACRENKSLTTYINKMIA